MNHMNMISMALGAMGMPPTYKKIFHYEEKNHHRQKAINTSVTTHIH